MESSVSIEVNIYINDRVKKNNRYEIHNSRVFLLFISCRVCKICLYIVSLHIINDMSLSKGNKYFSHKGNVILVLQKISLTRT